MSGKAGEGLHVTPQPAAHEEKPMRIMAFVTATLLAAVLAGPALAQA